jgi:alpha,alpha-trehalase
MNRRRAVRELGALAALLVPSLLVAADSAPNRSYPDPPQVLFKDLFAAVQMQAIYPDGKAFPDAIPNEPPRAILAEYHAAHPDSPQALRRFVDAHFALPTALSVVQLSATVPSGTLPSGTAQVGIVTHIDGLWDTLTRSTPAAARYSSMLPLPRPYVVPGGRFRELYYWDSYFTMLGLDESTRHDLVADMVRDFAYLIDSYGHVPNGTRSYYLSRSQPPFFFAMVGLLSSADAASAFAQYLPELRREYAFWMQGETGLRRGSAHRRVVAMPDGSILNRYWDDRDTPRDESYREDIELARASGRPAPRVFRDIRAAAESGWDFGSRWFADPQARTTIDTTEIVPIDLNSLLFGLENAIRSGCERQADRSCAADFAHRAARRHVAIDRYLWDASAGAYVDYHWTQHAPVIRLSAASLYPLFVGLATADQATAVANATRQQLLAPGGIVTTPLDTGQQWAPIQWIAVAGLRQYRQDSLAEAIACRWMLDVNTLYAQSGRLVEKYDVVSVGRSGRGGEYPTQDGFGWTNGVMRKLIALYPADADAADADACRE